MRQKCGGFLWRERRVGVDDTISKTIRVGENSARNFGLLEEGKFWNSDLS